MIQTLNKIKFLWRKPKIVIVTGNGRQTAKEAIEKVVGKDVLVLESEPKDSAELSKLKFFIKHSSLPVLVVTYLGGELDNAKAIAQLAAFMPAFGYSILNFDDEAARGIKNQTKSHILTFGFGVRADMSASDIAGNNFKINYSGHIVPIWLEGPFDKEHIYAALAAAAVGEVMGFNLVEISEALKC